MWVLVPTHTLHELFANHNDTEHEYCTDHQSETGTHVEKKHTHCQILDTNTPIYEKPSLVIFENNLNGPSTEINTIYYFSYLNQRLSLQSNRGPPSLV